MTHGIEAQGSMVAETEALRAPLAESLTREQAAVQRLVDAVDHYDLPTDAEGSQTLSVSLGRVDLVGNTSNLPLDAHISVEHTLEKVTPPARKGRFGITLHPRPRYVQTDDIFRASLEITAYGRLVEVFHFRPVDQFDGFKEPDGQYLLSALKVHFGEEATMEDSRMSRELDSSRVTPERVAERLDRLDTIVNIMAEKYPTLFVALQPTPAS